MTVTHMIYNHIYAHTGKFDNQREAHKIVEILKNLRGKSYWIAVKRKL